MASNEELADCLIESGLPFSDQTMLILQAWDYEKNWREILEQLIAEIEVADDD